MYIFLVDYENVNEAGLKGIKELKPDDQVYVFYSGQIKTIPFERSIEMTQSKAKIEFIQTHKTGKNYLDFQLSTFLGYLLGKGEGKKYIVVSKDTGFESVVDFWKGRNTDICRRENIAGQQPAPKAEVAKPEKKPKATATVTKKETQTKSGLPEAIKKEIRAAVKEDQLLPSNYTAIYKAFVESKDKLAFNNALVKSLQSKKGGQVYGHLKDIYEKHSKQ